MKTRHFRNLLVWQKAMALAETVYVLSEQFPKREMFGLTAQMRRCAVSVPSNIAEGHGRFSDPNLALFLEQRGVRGMSWRARRIWRSGSG
jgi:hypothetical protein